MQDAGHTPRPDESSDDKQRNAVGPGSVKEVAVPPVPCPCHVGWERGKLGNRGQTRSRGGRGNLSASHTYIHDTEHSHSAANLARGSRDSTCRGYRGHGGACRDGCLELTDISADSSSRVGNGRGCGSGRTSTGEAREFFPCINTRIRGLRLQRTVMVRTSAELAHEQYSPSTSRSFRETFPPCNTGNNWPRLQTAMRRILKIVFRSTSYASSSCCVSVMVEVVCCWGARYTCDSMVCL